MSFPGKDAPHGRLFSLLHEYVHLLLHTEGLCDVTTDQRAVSDKESLRARVAGIEARHWVAFFRAYAEGAQKGELHDRIMRQIARHRQEQNLDSDDVAILLREWVERLPGS